MDPVLIARVLFERQRLRLHERWDRERLESHRRSALERVRRYAVAHSPLYRELHRGLASAPLSELPVVSKAMLMSRFDDAVADRGLTLTALKRYLESGIEAPLEGRFRVSSTSGSSGLKAIIPSDAREWSAIVGSYARASDWSGGGMRVWKRSKMAVVSSTTPWHQSSRVARSVKSPFIASVRYDATMPLAELVTALNEQQPDVLIGYASMLGILAAEQIERRLRIRPRSINVSSEVFTPQARRLVSGAFGVEPFEVYAATETGGIGAECARHEGLHLFEDLLLVESVDDAYRPVASGELGTRTLVTVFHARTLPLIRYELTDRVRLSARRCACGLPFALIEGVEGRSDDVLSLPASDGTTAFVHPVTFERVLDDAAPAGWQVRASANGLRVLVVGDVAPLTLTTALRDAMNRARVRVELPIEVEAVTQVPAAAAGKRPRIVREPG